MGIAAEKTEMPERLGPVVGQGSQGQQVLIPLPEVGSAEGQGCPRLGSSESAAAALRRGQGWAAVASPAPRGTAVDSGLLSSCGQI